MHAGIRVGTDKVLSLSPPLSLSPCLSLSPSLSLSLTPTLSLALSLSRPRDLSHSQVFARVWAHFPSVANAGFSLDEV